MSQSNVIDLWKWFETRSPSSGSQPGKFSNSRECIELDAESMGQAILGLLDTAANKAEADVQRASEAAQQLSSQLNAAQGRIAELEAEVRLFREKAERAEMWLTMISTEIEDRFINEPQKERRLH